MTIFLTAESTTTDASVEQRTPRSKIFPECTSATALRMLALFSIYAGTFPDPTPYAGLPALYAVRTIGVLPVARIKETSRCFISSFVASIVGADRHDMRPWGAPAVSAACAMTFIASTVHRAARG